MASGRVASILSFSRSSSAGRESPKQDSSVSRSSQVASQIVTIARPVILAEFGCEFGDDVDQAIPQNRNGSEKLFSAASITGNAAVNLSALAAQLGMTVDQVLGDLDTAIERFNDSLNDGTNQLADPNFWLDTFMPPDTRWSEGRMIP